MAASWSAARDALRTALSDAIEAASAELRANANAMELVLNFAFGLFPSPPRLCLCLLLIR